MSNQINISQQQLAHRKKRVLYRASHRGTKEMDWLLGHYATEKIDAMDENVLSLFEKLIDLPDYKLEQWIIIPHLAREDKDYDIQWQGLLEDMNKFHNIK